jgi:hypothetical protein
MITYTFNILSLLSPLQWLFALCLNLYAILRIPVNAVQISEPFFQALNKGFFPFAQPYAWIIVFFIWLVSAFRVAQLTLQVIFLSFVEIVDTFPECPLHICIDIHFDNAIAQCFCDLVLRRTATTMEYIVYRFSSSFVFLQDKFLAIVQDHRTQLYITRGIHTMYVTKSSSNGETRTYFR